MSTSNKKPPPIEVIDLTDYEFPDDPPSGWDMRYWLDDIPDDLPDYHETWYDRLDEIHTGVLRCSGEFDYYSACCEFSRLMPDDHVAAGTPFRSGRHWVLRIRKESK